MSEGLLPPFLGYFSHVIRELFRAILDTLFFKPLVVGFTIAAQLASIYKERVVVVRVVQRTYTDFSTQLLQLLV